MTSLAEQLRERRTTARTAGDEILTRAATETRDLTPDEAREYADTVSETREIEDRLEEIVGGEIRELRAALPSHAGPVEHRGGHALLAELRALAGSGSTGGGAFTPTDFPSFFFDRLAAMSVGLRSGFRVIRTDRDSVIVPRWTADTSSAWTAEAGTITSTDGTADQITATPRKLAALQAISNEAVNDSNPALMDVVASGLVRSMALKADFGFYEGSGTAPEIRGLKNVAGIGAISMGTNGLAAVNFDPFADALGTLEQANTEGQAIVMHPRTWQGLLKIKEISGSAKPVLQDSAGAVSQGVQRSIYGVPVYLTSQLSTTETQGTSSLASSAYVYDPTQVVAVVRQDVRVERDSSRLFNSDQSEMRAICRMDLVVPNPAAVVRIAGLL